MSGHARTLQDAIAALRESEIIGIERNNPPGSRCRELWPTQAQPLIDLLSTFLPLAEHVDHNGVWGNPDGINAALAVAQGIVTASREGLPSASREGVAR